MGGAGIITLVGLLLLLPFVMARDYFGKIARLDPRNGALTKASHGAGMLALGVWALAIHDRMGIAGPLLWIPLAVGGFGLFWLVAGWRTAKMIGGPVPGDDFLLVRAGLRVGVGVVLFWLLGAGPQALGYDTWQLVLDFIWLVRAAAIWFFITGAAKLGLLLAMRSRPSGTMPAATARNPAARYADPVSARQAMRGRGGQYSRMDSREF
jgi:hypothetical protein